MPKFAHRYVEPAVKCDRCDAWMNDVFEARGVRLCSGCASSRTRRRVAPPKAPAPKVDYFTPLTAGDIQLAKDRRRL